MIMAVVALLISSAIGFLLLRLLFPIESASARWASVLFRVCAGGGIGAGVTSTLQYVVLLLGGGGRWVQIAVEIVVLALLAALAWVRRPSKAEPLGEPGPSFRWNLLLGGAAASGLVIHLLSLAKAVSANPWGDWDAWCIWNVRAKYLAGGADTWRNAVSGLIDESQPGYPLLLPALLARCWQYTGAASEEVPLAVCVWFLLSVIGLLVSTLALLRGVSGALLAALVLLSTNSFLYQGHRLYADLPLCFYMLGSLTFLLWAEVQQTGTWRPAVLAGACAAFAAWTKSEGLVFAGVFLGVAAVVRWRALGWRACRDTALAILAGAAPVLLLVLHFKFALAPPGNPFLSGPASETAGRLLEIGRYAQVGAAFLRQAWVLGEPVTHPLLLLGMLAVALGVRPAPQHKLWRQSAALTVALMLASYFALYLVTSLPLDWLLSTSVDRLLAQVWPAFLLIAFMMLGRPEDKTASLPFSAHAQRALRKEKPRRG